MIETISVIVNGKTYKYSKGITLLEIANELEKDRKHPKKKNRPLTPEVIEFGNKTIAPNRKGASANNEDS